MSDVRVALDKILGEASAFSEGSPQSDAFFRIQGLAQRALAELGADAVLVAPREPQLTQYAMQRRCQNDCHDIGCMDDTPHQCHDFQCRQWPVYLASEVDALVAGLRQALADEQKQHQAVLAGLRSLSTQWRDWATASRAEAMTTDDPEYAERAIVRAQTHERDANDLDKWLAQALAGRTEQGNDH